MIAAAPRMTCLDFVLLGCSVAVLIVFLWPADSARQLVGIRSSSGEFERYSVRTDDPSLQILRRRIEKWQNSPTSRALRVARWQAAVAAYYCARANGDSEQTVAPVSFTDGDDSHSNATAQSYWVRLRDDAQVKIAMAEKQLQRRTEPSDRPVTFGPITRPHGAPLAYPAALLAAAATVALAIRRQRVRPPIEIGLDTADPLDSLEIPTIYLPMPSNWLRVVQPAEVLAWRGLYAILVGSAAACLLSVVMLG